MGFLERINRILVSSLLLIVFLQIGLLFFLKSMQEEAQYRLVSNTTKASLVCGEEQFKSKNYWNLLNEKVQDYARCASDGCNNSRVLWQQPDQDKELHLISIAAPPPLRLDSMEQGGVVKVKIKKTDKKQIIALVNRAPLEWNFEIEMGAQIEKIIIATPTTAWLQGVPPHIPLEYLPKDKLCSYPYTWEEAYNPDNEFRTLAAALKKITNLDLNSFQGAEIGRDFLVPAVSKNRMPASAQIKSSTPLPPSVPSPVVWARAEGQVIAEKYKLENGEEILLPAKTKQVLKADKDIFVLIEGRLHTWNFTKHQFEVLESPLSIAEVDEVSAMTYDPEARKVIFYNDQRSGEFYSYDLAAKSWTLLQNGFRFNVSALYYDTPSKQLMALVYRGPTLVGLVTLDFKGFEKFREFKNKPSFDQKRWRLSLDKQGAEWMATVVSPQDLQGESWPLL